MLDLAIFGRLALMLRHHVRFLPDESPQACLLSNLILCNDFIRQFPLAAASVIGAE